MKKIIFTFIISFLFSGSSIACEFCGCGIGNYYIGLLPQFSRHFIGVRHQFSSFKTVMKDEPGQYSNDVFQSTEIWGGMNIGKRWQMLAIVPYNFIHQTSDDGTVNRNGMGDIVVMGNYKIFDIASATASKKLVKQQIWLGAGIKFGTGKFSINPEEEAVVAQANTQTGSASNDFLLNAMHNISIGSFGVNTSARYKINTANKDEYRFGNRFSINSLAYYSFVKDKSKTSFTPNAGLMFENNESVKFQKQNVAQTGGYLFCAAAGVEVGIKKITVGCNAQLPLAQNFSVGQTKTKFRGMVHVTFVL
jgi:hypothetical protein